MQRHTIHRHHCGWDNSLIPVAHVAPGESLEFEVADASGGQLCPTSTARRCGPSGLRQGQSGHRSRVHRRRGSRGRPESDACCRLRPPDGAGPRISRGSGFCLRTSRNRRCICGNTKPRRLAPALFGRWGKVPLKPFTGTIGLAPAEPGLHSVVPPRRVGGNMDIRDLAQGAELFLPVEVEGALFSVGDTHAAQGDGEVCGTAIESPMRVALRFDLLKGQPLELSALPDAGTRHPPSRRQGLRGDHRDRTGPDAGRARRGPIDDRAVDPRARHDRHGRVHAVQRVRRSCASAKSSICRTGRCPSIFRARCSIERGSSHVEPFIGKIRQHHGARPPEDGQAADEPGTRAHQAVPRLAHHRIRRDDRGDRHEPRGAVAAQAGARRCASAITSCPHGSPGRTTTASSAARWELRCSPGSRRC